MANERWTVSPEGGDFRTLTEAVLAARQTWGAHLYAEAGEYDIFRELDAVYGNFLAGYDHRAPEGRGLEIGRGMTLEFSANAKIVCHYTGENPEIRVHFSPLYLAAEDCCLKNVTIEASNVRYCIHDDPLLGKEHRYTHELEGCRLTLDNRRALPGIDTVAVLGGGLNHQSYVTVRDCTFHSVGIAPTRACASYHNCVLDHSASQVLFRGCWCERGTIRFGMYGPSREMTTATVSGCSMESEPGTYFEVPAQYKNENITLHTFCNEIRKNEKEG